MTFTPDLDAPFPDPVADCAIADYGAIGDCRTVALVSRYGSLDWWCAPEVSSPSLFASLLDRERGGRFAITPRDLASAEQHYLPDSNVLQTRFQCRGGVLELTEFMTLPEASSPGHELPPHEVVRIVRCVEGSVVLEVLFDPQPDYARRTATLTPGRQGQWLCTAGEFEAQLSTTVALQPVASGGLRGSVAMQAGDCHAAMLHTGPRPDEPPWTLTDAQDRLTATLDGWRDWCSRFSYDGRYAEPVKRSALALKLLTHRPTGAVVAAATTSLPESETGERNWDYRYCWLRDTSLVLHAFTDLGYVAESRAFLAWLLHATRGPHPKRLQALYTVHGETQMEEEILPHLRGYHGIGPVRIGNAASEQVQHDVYGEILLTTCDEIEMGGSLSEDEKVLLAGFTETVCELWREPDHGIWEIRLPARHNTHSKLMCWAALDRALILHRDQGLRIDADLVRHERDAIRADIEAHGFNQEVNSYVGYYGSRAADSSVLLMPRLGYIDANDPRMRGTVDHVLRELSVDGLLQRYPPGAAYDGVEGPEHLFAICSFWCVDCLARQGRLEEATAMYERLLALRNPVGLFAEEFRIDDGSPMGNFPQAFSHVGAITAALSLARAGRGETGTIW